MLQALNMLENLDLKAMGYNSARYIHALYQVDEPGLRRPRFLLRRSVLSPRRADPGTSLQGLRQEPARSGSTGKGTIRRVRPGDPYPFEGRTNPFLEPAREMVQAPRAAPTAEEAAVARAFFTGTTSIQAADEEGWVVSVTPSGGWIPACMAGKTGIGMSQRMQSFVLDAAENPFNVVAPGKRPRATLTPGLALKDGKPYLSFAVQGGDTQDQNLLQFFLNVVEFGMNVQEACEAANITSYQMRNSFDGPQAPPGQARHQRAGPGWVRDAAGVHGLQDRPPSSRPRGRSTPSSSTGPTAPSGAAAAITGRITGSPGDGACRVDVRRGIRGGPALGLFFYACLAAGCALFGGLKAGDGPRSPHSRLQQGPAPCGESPRSEQLTGAFSGRPLPAEPGSLSLRVAGLPPASRRLAPSGGRRHHSRRTGPFIAP